MPFLELGTKVAARFGYNLDASLYQPSFLPVGLERTERYTDGNALNVFNGFNNVGQSSNERSTSH